MFTFICSLRLITVLQKLSPLSPTPNSVEVNDILHISTAGDGPVELTFRGRVRGGAANLSVELTPPYLCGQHYVLRMPKQGRLKLYYCNGTAKIKEVKLKQNIGISFPLCSHKLFRIRLTLDKEILKI